MTPRDELGDKIPLRDVAHEHDTRDADRRHNQPRTRTRAPKTAGTAPPKWADEYPEVWRD